MDNHILPGDILCFAPDKQSKSWFGYALDTTVVIGERLEHPSLSPNTPLFYHVGMMLGTERFAEENGICHESTLSSLPSTQELWIKRLDLTYQQRLNIPEAAQTLYGTRYDLPLDFYLGARYIWHGMASALNEVSCGLIQLPAIHIGEEEHHRLICTTFDATVLRNVGYKGLRKRFYSPEGLAIDLPGPLWRLQ